MQNRGLTLTPPKALYYLIFTVSGFSGLIYESIWSHYLKLFLGHAAYAQSLVLSIFMGGMAIGAWLAGQYSPRWRSPILIYAIVEGIIGVLALIFHNSFLGITDLAYTSILPATDSVMAAHLLKWSIAALMIIPQSILLGMTFPLMTAGIIRRYPERSGGTISLLYFTNSIGAAAGVLASGFWLIAAVGLPGTIMTAGVLNILLALTVWVVIKLDPATAALKSTTTRSVDRNNKLLLLAAFVTGMASFIYEIGWIRMLSLVLGSSTHAFELMLSAFITGLALGGLWIRKRIDSFTSPVGFAARVQIAMGILALLTLPLYGLTFEWMAQLTQVLNRTDAAYSLLLFASHGIALAIMLPATFCAGMTLPLFTHSLLQSGYGEKSIGRIYAFNTAGAIAGVLLAVNALPVLGLKNLIGAGALLDIALGLALLVFMLGGNPRYRKQLVTVSIGVIAAFCLIFGLSHLSPAQLASGVFRYGDTQLPKGAEIFFYRDGKTASVSVYGETETSRTVTTNGKPDASIRYGADARPSQDENTMVLAAALPYGFKPDARTVANIGLGSGLTTHSLLRLAQIEQLDTIEIESAVVEASKHFGSKVALAHTDPRSRIHIEDAKTFFSVNNRQYDIIVSEPSNPWVSGVSSLFTAEFYAQINRYLVDDGIFTQWIHLYENNWQIISSVLKALDANFSDYALYATNDLDILIIARKQGVLGALQAEKILQSGLRDDLAQLNIRTPSDLHYRLLATRAILTGSLRQTPIPANSDYFPYLDNHAHRAFFKARKSLEYRLDILPLPLLELLQPADFYAVRDLTLKSDFTLATLAHAAANVRTGLLQNKLPEGDTAKHIGNLAVLLLNSARCDQPAASELWLRNWHVLARFLIANLDRQSALPLWQAPPVTACYARAQPALKAWIDFYKSVAARNGGEMTRQALQLLETGAGGRDAELNSYLLGAAMLGAYQNGRPQDTVKIWDYYSNRLFKTGNDIPFYFRIIVAAARNNN
jgi:spermidine synthase